MNQEKDIICKNLLNLLFFLKTNKKNKIKTKNKINTKNNKTKLFK